jgi:7-cyano-7-deazaguanine synthase
MSAAVVLLSGGLDSTVCATIATKNHRIVYPFSIHYGQKHEGSESRAALAVARQLGIAPVIQINIPDTWFMGSGSALVDKSVEIPDVSYDEIEGVSPTYVPFRNGIFTSIAAAMALKYNAEAVYFGAHSEDAQNWAYPDCTPEFIGSMAAAIYVGTYKQVRLITPLQWLMKRDIVELGNSINAPMHLSWSCYKGGGKHCGICPTCLSRKEAFRLAGVEDKTVYER